MAMAKGSWSLDQWREYFQSADSDIFDVIEQAMIIAASDHPHEFMQKQDRFQGVFLACKEANHDNGSYETMDESKCILEASRIKGILDNSKQQSSEVLHNSLRKLQLMPMSRDILKITEIGKSVRALRKHELKEIGGFAATLIRDWKLMVISWMETMEAGSEDPQTAGGESDENGLKHSHVNDYQPHSTTTMATNSETTTVMTLTPPTPVKPLHGGRKPPRPPMPVKKNCQTEDSLEMKLEASKRKLRERYQEAEQMKKQRTIKVLELSELPKHRVETRIHHKMRWGNHNPR